MPGEPSKALAGAEWCVGGSWQQFSCLSLKLLAVLPWLPWEYSCCPELSPACCNTLRPWPQHQAGCIPSPANLRLTFLILGLHQVCFGCMMQWAVGKQTVPLCGPFPVHQVPGVGGRWFFRLNHHTYHRAIGCEFWTPRLPPSYSQRYDSSRQQRLYPWPPTIHLGKHFPRLSRNPWAHDAPAAIIVAGDLRNMMVPDGYNTLIMTSLCLVGQGGQSCTGP